MLKNFVRFSGPMFIITAALLWALDGVIRRHLYTLPPIIIIFFEHLIGLIILLPFVWKHVFKTRFTKREFGLLVLISVLSGLLGTLWFTTALLKVNFISFSVVFLLQKLQPIFAITTASIFLKEKFERGYIPWALLALLSAYFVTFKNGVVNLETGEGTVIAALYALGAAFAWGSSTTFSKMLLGKVEPKVSTFYRFLFTIIIAFPVVFLLGKGVECESLDTDKFKVSEQIKELVDSGGKILACGTCLKIRHQSGSAVCPLSSMQDLYDLIKSSDKVITF